MSDRYGLSRTINSFTSFQNQKIHQAWKKITIHTTIKDTTYLTSVCWRNYCNILWILAINRGHYQRRLARHGHWSVRLSRIDIVIIAVQDHAIRIARDETNFSITPGRIIAVLALIPVTSSWFTVHRQVIPARSVYGRTRKKKRRRRWAEWPCPGTAGPDSRGESAFRSAPYRHSGALSFTTAGLSPEAWCNMLSSPAQLRPARRPVDPVYAFNQLHRQEE